MPVMLGSWCQAGRVSTLDWRTHWGRGELERNVVVGGRSYRTRPGGLRCWFRIVVPVPPVWFQVGWQSSCVLRESGYEFGQFLCIFDERFDSFSDLAIELFVAHCRGVGLV